MMNVRRPTERGLTSRRDFLRSGAVFVPALSVSAAISPQAQSQSLPQSMLIPGAPDAPYGNPSEFESSVTRIISSQKAHSTMASSLTPIHMQKGIITPSGLHFGVHHSGIPEINPDSHELYIHGLVEKALRFSVRNLLRYPVTGGIHFLECSGNSWRQALSDIPSDQTCSELYGLISSAEWIGVPVRLLLNEAGIRRGASWVIAEGADSASLTRSIPIQKLLDDAIIALYQNGERLRPAQGYPIRLILPGWEGNTNVKWLRRLEVVDQPAYTKGESRTYSETLADGTIEQFSLQMGVKSVITHPSAGHVLPARGYYEIQGLAWSGAGKISAVEVSEDNGHSWAQAELHEPILDKSFTRFSLPWGWAGQAARLQSRATDEYGNRQPTRKYWRTIYLEGSYNHYNAIQTWEVRNDGVVKNVF